MWTKNVFIEAEEEIYCTQAYLSNRNEGVREGEEDVKRQKRGRGNKLHLGLLTEQKEWEYWKRQEEDEEKEGRVEAEEGKRKPIALRPIYQTETKLRGNGRSKKKMKKNAQKGRSRGEETY